MVYYTLKLTLADNQQCYDHQVDLTLEQENFPERLLEPRFADNLRQELQGKCDRHIDQGNLQKILQLWIEDIKEGYRETLITIDLPPLLDQDIWKKKYSQYKQIPKILEPDAREIKPCLGVFPPLDFN